MIVRATSRKTNFNKQPRKKETTPRPANAPGRTPSPRRTSNTGKQTMPTGASKSFAPFEVPPQIPSNEPKGGEARQTPISGTLAKATSSQTSYSPSRSCDPPSHRSTVAFIPRPFLSPTALTPIELPITMGQAINPITKFLWCPAYLGPSSPSRFQDDLANL